MRWSKAERNAIQESTEERLVGYGVIRSRAKGLLGLEQQQGDRYPYKNDKNESAITGWIFIGSHFHSFSKI